MRVPRIAAVLLWFVATALGCSDATEEPAQANSAPDAPELEPFEVVDSTSAQVDPDAGAVLSLGGATLEIPAGTLSQAAEIGLWQTTVSSLGLPADDGALSGQVLLSDRAFFFVSDQAVTLSGPVFLTLPIDPERVPAEADIQTAQVSAVVGGYVVPQGLTESVDGANSTLRIRLEPGTIPGGFAALGAAGPPGLGLGVPFIAVLAKLRFAATVAALGAQLLYPLVATLDDIRSIANYAVQVTDNFRIRYGVGIGITPSQVEIVAAALESAHDLFVDQMGFTLPNVINFDGRYTVYIDNLEDHVLLPGAPDGFTLAGAFYVEGASYVHNGTDPSQWAPTAVHEYFHALQFGALTRLVPNSVGQGLDVESSWLFEGSTTALTSRLIEGQGAPARSSGLAASHLAQTQSIWEDAAQDPASDVAQDFFFYLERRLGGVAFYLPMFQALGTDNPLRSFEPSVSAVDDVLAELGTSLRNEWGSFVRELLFDGAAAYGAPPDPVASATLAVGGDSRDASVVMPPLSYQLRTYTVPAFRTDALESSQPSDVMVTASVSESVGARIFVQRPGGAAEELLSTGAGSADELVLFGVRGTADAVVRVGVANTRLGVDESLTIDLSVRLLGEEGPTGSDSCDRLVACVCSTPGEESAQLCAAFSESYGPGGSCFRATNVEDPEAFCNDACQESLSAVQEAGDCT